jgi:O-antigen/teichoic acid export membrane protein
MSDVHSTRAYFINIAWSWLGFVTIFGSSAIVMPMLIRHLGTAQFGIWALAVSLVEYFWLIDLGLRPATVKLSAEFRALGRTADLNSLINTALAYSCLAGLLVLAVTWPNVGRIARTLHIDNPAFSFLVRIVSLSWAAGLVFNVFAAVLEGFQRFDLSNRVSIISTLLRGSFSLGLVLAGYGLREMAVVLLLSQSTGYAMTYWYCSRVHPELRFAPKLVSRVMTGKLLAYARQIVSGIIGGRISMATLPSLIAYFKPVQFVTYFTQTQRMMEYAADAISRVALVTTPRATDWYARGYRKEIVDLARFANRYCLTMWGLLASYLFIYGGNLCRIWINREFGDWAAILLPLFLGGYTLWMSQFVSAAVLMGIARYTAFSLTIFGESIVSIGCMAVILPRFGLPAAVGALAVTMAISRFVILSYLFTREFKLSQLEFLWSIFCRPGLLMGGSVGALWLCREYLVPGRTWFELISVGLLLALVYVPLAFQFVLDKEHQDFILLKVRSKWDSFRARSTAGA